jgi:uncharacterized protein with FMN-binding domain
MKSSIQSVVVAVALAAPVAVFAQSNQPVTRAQVRAELVQLENAGYKPGLASPYYPADFQAAQAKVTAQNGSASAVGGVVSGASASGAHAYKTETGATGPQSVYFGGQ